MVALSQSLLILAFVGSGIALIIAKIIATPDQDSTEE